MTAGDLLVVVDGAVDAPLSGSARFEVVNGQVHFGEARFDGSPETLWELLRKGSYPSTTPPTVGALAAAYEQAGHVVGVHVSAALSATVTRAKEAAARVQAHSGSQVTVVDTRSLSVGSGLIAAALVSALDRRGTDAAAIARQAQRLPGLLHTFALVQDVDTLRASGRAGLLPPGRLDHHRPLLLAVRGRAVPLEQCRDRRGAVDRLAAHLRHSLGTTGRRPGGGHEWALGHGAAPDVTSVAARLSELLGCPPRFVVPVDPTVGVHVGPDALIVASLTEDRVR